MTNLVRFMSVYRDAIGWVVINTDRPGDDVEIGCGDTLREAYNTLQRTPIKSAQDQPVQSALLWATRAGWFTDRNKLVLVPDADLEDQVDVDWSAGGD